MSLEYCILVLIILKVSKNKRTHGVWSANLGKGKKISSYRVNWLALTEQQITTSADN